jgi:hypothetical protein
MKEGNKEERKERRKEGRKEKKGKEAHLYFGTSEQMGQGFFFLCIEYV